MKYLQFFMTESSLTARFHISNSKSGIARDPFANLFPHLIVYKDPGREGRPQAALGDDNLHRTIMLVGVGVATNMLHKAGESLVNV